MKVDWKEQREHKKENGILSEINPTHIRPVPIPPRNTTVNGPKQRVLKIKASTSLYEWGTLIKYVLKYVYLLEF